MENYSTIFLIIYIIVLALFINFYIKIYHFVTQSMILYNDMIKNQKELKFLLLDIRDNTKTYESKIKVLDVLENTIDPGTPPENSKICEKCQTPIPTYYKRCPKCGNKFE